MSQGCWRRAAIAEFVKESTRNTELLAAWGGLAAELTAAPVLKPKTPFDPEGALEALKSKSAKQLAKLPEQTKLVLGYFFILVVLPILLDFYGPYLKPYMPYLPEKQDSSVDERGLKEIRTDPAFARQSGYRVIEGDRVHVRAGPSMKAEILDQLRAGQIVRVVSKQRPWIEIEYEDDGEKIRGWVVIRYTRPFAR